MESLGSDTYVQASMSFSGAAELPPKKRALERGKAVFDKSEENNLEIDLNSSGLPPISLAIGEIAPTKLETILLDEEPEKSLPDQAPQKALPDQALQNADAKSEEQSSEPCNIDLHPKKDETVESFDNPQPQSPPKNQNICKFCGQTFSTSQALGGHQNAHKQEREMQKAMKAAQDNPLGYHMLSARMAPFYHGSHYGHHSQYAPYQGYVAGRWPTRPIYPYPYPRMGLVQDSPSIAEGLVHRQHTLNQGHIQSQPTLAQGLVQGQPNVAQGLFQVQPSVHGLVHGKPSHPQGLVHGQPHPHHAQGIIHNHPSHAQGIIHNQPSYAQDVVHGQPSHNQSVMHDRYLMKPISHAYNPEWPTTYVSPSSPIRADGFTRFNPSTNSNLTTFMQIRENEGNLAQKQCMGSTGLNFSLNASPPEIIV